MEIDEPVSDLERVLVEAYKDEMVDHLDAHPEDLSEAIDLAVGTRPRYAWRAAWLVGNGMTADDPRLKHEVDRLIHAMPGKPDGHWRELMKIVMRMRLNDEQEGRVFEMALSQWQDPGKQASVRWMAFRFMADMVKKYPALAGEVKLLLRPELVEPLSPGIRRSVAREVKQILAVEMEC